MASLHFDTTPTLQKNQTINIMFVMGSSDGSVDEWLDEEMALGKYLPSTVNELFFLFL